MDLLILHGANRLNHEIYWDNGDHSEHPCYKATINSVIHEIIHREVTTNEAKLESIQGLQKFFTPLASSPPPSDSQEKSQSTQKRKKGNRAKLDMPIIQ